MPMVDLPGYRVSYGGMGRWNWIRFIFQLPKILIQIKRENRWLRRFVRRESLDGIISDNRYGLHAPGIDSVFITHQLQIRSGLGPLADGILRKVHYRMIGRFSRCWVPDFPVQMSLAGALSHPALLPNIPVRYIGPLTRLQRQEDHLASDQYDVLVLLSGPEPQRSGWEKMIVRELHDFRGSALLVRGIPHAGPAPQIGNHVHTVNHLSGAALSQAISGSSVVISRSGYSTVMDLLLLGKKCILVPTPGQPEQVYLARYLASQGWIMTLPQSKFSIRQSLRLSAQFEYAAFPRIPPAALEAEVSAWIAQITPRTEQVDPPLPG